MTKKIDLHALLLKYPSSTHIHSSSLLQFNGIDEGYCVYNITPPSLYNGNEILFGRVEQEDNELAEAWMFEKQSNVWESTDVRVPNLQDPFYTIVGDEIIFGGVRVGHYPSELNQEFCYYTAFWRIKTWHDLTKTQPFAYGPPGQKDIRLVDLGSSIGVFTRPQGSVGGRGIIGFTQIKSLEDITTEIIEKAAPIEDLESLLDKTHVWGGVNEAHGLKNTHRIGVIGHIAYRTDFEGNIVDHNQGVRHYHGFTFIFDPETRKVIKPRLILTRQNLPPGKTKKLKDSHVDDLKDVVFTGGGRYNEETGIFTLYGGAGDAEAFAVSIEFPFHHHEDE